MLTQSRCPTCGGPVVIRESRGEGDTGSMWSHTSELGDALADALEAILEDYRLHYQFFLLDVGFPNPGPDAVAETMKRNISRARRALKEAGR